MLPKRGQSCLEGSFSFAKSTLCSVVTFQLYRNSFIYTHTPPAEEYLESLQHLLFLFPSDLINALYSMYAPVGQLEP